MALKECVISYNFCCLYCLLYKIYELIIIELFINKYSIIKLIAIVYIILIFDVLSTLLFSL